MTRILLLNPNTTHAITMRLATAARPMLAPETELVTATAPRGFPYISSRAEAQVAGAIVLDMLAEREGTYDAAIIAAFGDPGLIPARELFERPVIGMSEAAMLTACMLGKRFGIVTFTRAMEPWYAECVEMHGLSGRCSGIHGLDARFGSVTEIAEEKQAALVALAQDAVSNGADVVILAGAPLAGLAAAVKTQVPVPLIDQVQAAARQAETLAMLGPCKARAGAFARPSAKESTGLSIPLGARFSHTDTRDVKGG